jgi:hypothetical protein
LCRFSRNKEHAQSAIRPAVCDADVPPACHVYSGCCDPLAVGIGANTALFAFIDAMFLRQIPAANADELVVFGWRSGPSRAAFAPVRGGASYVSSRNRGEGVITTRLAARFPSDLPQRFLRENKTLADIAAFANVDLDATIDGSAEEITAQLVSGSYFRTVGVRPAAGRLIANDDDAAPAAPVAVISHGFWHRKLAADPSAIGKTVVLNGTLTATIVGVMPPDFHIGNGLLPDLTVLLAFEPQLARGLTAPENWGIGIVGRVKPGVTLEQVRGSLQGLFRGVALNDKPNTAQADLPTLEVMSAGRGFTGDSGFQQMSPGRTAQRFAFLAVMAGVFVILLLIVSLNIANLKVWRAGSAVIRSAGDSGRARIRTHRPLRLSAWSVT